MTLDINIEKTTFSKQIYDAGKRAACDEFMHSIGYMMGYKQIKLNEDQKQIIFQLSARELSDLNLLLHKDGTEAEVIAFLESPRNSTPRSGRTEQPETTYAVAVDDFAFDEA